MPWIIKREPNTHGGGFVAAHASGVEIDLLPSNASFCLCRLCQSAEVSGAIDRWLESLPEPPAALIEAVRFEGNGVAL